MKLNRIVGVAGLVTSMLVASTAFSQSFTVSEHTALSGSATVAVDWELVVGGGMEGTGIDLHFDETLINPVLDSGGPAVLDCFSSTSADLPPACSLGAPGLIRITVSNFPGNTLSENANGTITFNLDASVAVGDTIPITLSVADIQPPGTTIDLNEGLITVIDTPPEEISELSVTPASIDFGTVDLGGMPVTETITATNIGGASSTLNISDASFSGDAVFTIATNNCAGTDLAAGESCDVVVEFNAGADGVYTGSVDFTSDADTNPNASVSVTGEAGSAPDLSVTPGPGTINLGTGLQGDVLTSGGSFSNAGSAAGDVSCTVSGAEFSTVPSPIAGTIEPGGSLDFSVQCTLPADAEDGDTFGGVLACSGNIDASWELSCGVSEWEPLPVPTMQKWGLIVLTLMMLMVGGLSIRFFRG